MSDISGTKRTGLTCTWKIKNFIWNVNNISDILNSPQFNVRINESCTKWCLRLWTGRTKESIAFYLMRVDDEEPKKISVGFELSCKTADGKSELAFHEDSHEFVKNVDGGKTDNVWNSLRMMDNKSLYFPNDNFTVRCQMWSSSQFVIHPAEYLAVTHLEVTSITYYKDIHDFYSLGLPLKCSPTLCNDLEITLHKKETSEYLSVEFRLKSPTKSEKRLGCRLSVQNSGGILVHEMEKENLFYSNEDVWKFPDFIKMNELIVADNCFENPHLRFDFKVHSGQRYSSLIEVSNIRPLDASEDGLCVHVSQSRELENLYSEKKYTDVEIRIDKERFPAHKVILCARSPVFAAMFDNDMVEKETNIVQIDDVDAAIFEIMLSFMYSGVVKNLDENNATKLFSAADKYQVLMLKKKCANFLKNIISTKNACLLLQLADSHNDESLQKAAQEFICNHHREMFSSDEWRLFTRHHGDLASEIFQKLSVRYSNV